MDPTWDYYSTTEGHGSAYYQLTGYWYTQGQWPSRSLQGSFSGTGEAHFDTNTVQESPVTDDDTSSRVIEVS